MNQPVYRSSGRSIWIFPCSPSSPGWSRANAGRRICGRSTAMRASMRTARSKGLYGFLRYGARPGADRAHGSGFPAPAGDYVRICTIHKSRAWVPRGISVRQRRPFQHVRFEREAAPARPSRLGSRLRDLDKKKEYTTLARDAVELALRRETIAEELRVLYVAMTRAREKLIVTACIREDKPGASLRRIGLQQLAPDPYGADAGGQRWTGFWARRCATPRPFRCGPSTASRNPAGNTTRTPCASSAGTRRRSPRRPPCSRSPRPLRNRRRLRLRSPRRPHRQTRRPARTPRPERTLRLARRMSSRNPAPARIRVPLRRPCACARKVSVSDLKRACACRMRTASRSTTRRISPPARLSPPGRDELTPRRRALALHKFMQFSTTEARAGTAAAQMQARGIIGEAGGGRGRPGARAPFPAKPAGRAHPSVAAHI